ncbi:MAG: hypothetical protein O9284_05000 [Steroidobacteraceae bacterium]|jgi:Tol biopolymer transport system component/DNA-binding winged helix-turn-helix (wHTH) protein|nr:hypothetical protein [Steroidobacteraceae bacterium]
MKRRSYLELGKRNVFGKPQKKPIGPVAPPPDPQQVPDFDLGTWRVRPALARMTRADRLVALEELELRTLLCLVEAPPEGVNREELALRVFGKGESIDERLKRILSFLRRVFSEDGAVRIENAPGDAYRLVVGEPVRSRPPGASGVADAEGLSSTPLDRGLAPGSLKRRRKASSILIAGVVVAAIGTGFWLLLDDGGKVLYGRVTGTASLANAPGPELSPSFSPDARQAVYSWQREGTRDAKLYVRGVGAAGGAPRALTSGPGEDINPAWSPAGGLIAFQRVDGPQCEVFVIVPDGTGERRIGECSADALGPLAWRPDGSAVIYAFRTAPVLPTQLVAVTLADLKMTGVTNPVIGMPGDSQPELASTGRRLAFQRSRSVGVADLSMIELSIGEVERVTRDGLELYGSTWEPGGRSILFASPRGGRGEIWRTRFDGTFELVVGSRRGDLRAPTLSGDGTRLAYERWNVQTRLLAVPLTADLEQPPSPWLTPTAFDREPQLSPDRSRVAFVSDRDGRDQLWMVESAPDAAPRVLTRFDVDGLQAPRWSPDGRRLVVAAAQGGRWSLWLVDAADGSASRIDTGAASQAFAPSFSRDGRWLYYAADSSGRWEIWRREWPDGSAAQQLTQAGGLAALESRDGEFLYFVRPDRNGLWRRSREPGGDDLLVTGELAAADWNNWFVTEDGVYFVARPDRENAQLAKWSLTEEAVQRIRPLPGLLPRSGLTLSPDGRAVLATQVAKTEVDLEVATLE